MIDPDHVNLAISRVLIPPEQWEDKTESELVTGLHALACMAAFHEWTDLFTFVCLKEDGAIDHVTFGIEDTTPVDFMEVIVTELVRLNEGRILAVALHIGAWTGRDGEGPPTKEAKYVITISSQENILVSSMIRDMKSGVVENNGKWLTAVLEHAALDASGEVKNIARKIQREIQQYREKREPNV